MNGLCLAERRDFVNTVKHGRTRSERQVAVATAFFYGGAKYLWVLNVEVAGTLEFHMLAFSFPSDYRTSAFYLLLGA